jgi:phosphoribosyl-dephospho-CoA transferase
MRRFVLTATLLVATLGVQLDSSAANCCCCQQSRPVCCRGKSKSVLEKLWELEQRKNAWLVRTFLGRCR